MHAESVPDASQGPELGIVLSLDNVPVELPLARLGSRVLAGVVDYLLLFLVLAAWSVGVLVLAKDIGLRPGWGVAIWLLGAFAIDYGYFALQEILLDGRTAGKRIFGLRVVGHDGAAAGNGALLLRNLVRIIDVLIGVPLMALDPLSRRLGDRLAGTLVVHDRAHADEVLLARLPGGWGATEARVVESFLRRASELEPTARATLARRMAGWVDERAPGFLPGGSADDPLERLFRGFRAGQ